MEAVDALLAAGDLDAIAPHLDDLELRLAAQAATGASPQADWPWALHLVAHLLRKDRCAARFLWRRMPAQLRERPREGSQIQLVGEVVRAAWRRDRATLLHAIACALSTEKDARLAMLLQALAECERSAAFELACRAYSTISIDNCSRMLALSPEQAVAYATERGWVTDEAAGMLLVRMPAKDCSQQVRLDRHNEDIDGLRHLTQYVVHLEQP
eukprot:jgi/Chlat1/2506/Chrsp175S02372